jgi:hypothetical protein
MNKSELASLHISIPIKWKEELEEIAKEKDASISDVARDFIDRGLHSQEAQGKEYLILGYLRKNPRTYLMLIWDMVSDSRALIKYLVGDWTREIEEDMAIAYESCFTIIKILDKNSLANLVIDSSFKYWDRLAEIMQYLVNIQRNIRAYFNNKDTDLDVIKNLSPLIKENLEGLLLDIIESLSVRVAMYTGAKS